MAKKIKSCSEEAYTEGGQLALSEAGKEIIAALRIISERTGADDLQAIFMLRDACQMLSAKHRDAELAKTQAQIKELNAELAKLK